MKNNEAFALIIALIAGAFSILASILNWDFFFNNRKAYWVVNLFGRNGARIFYIVLGLVIIGLGTAGLVQ